MKYCLFSFTGDIASLVPTVEIEVKAEEDKEIIEFLEDLRMEDLTDNSDIENKSHITA